MPLIRNYKLSKTTKRCESRACIDARIEVAEARLDIKQTFSNLSANGIQTIPPVEPRFSLV